LAGVEGIELPYEPLECIHTYYLYAITLKKEWAGEKRDALIKMMNDEYGIGCVVANAPQYLSRKMLADAYGKTTPKSEEYASRMMCISLHPTMSSDDNRYICAALITCLKKL
jgi:dTDP-4-amino-4,6-dideoxygalactose transaminase